MDREFRVAELTADDEPAVIALCRTALDLPEDAAEAAEIVGRLRDTTGADGWSPVPRRLTGFLARTGGDRVIGVVLGSLSHRDAAAGHVDLLAVDPAERRRGVGRALLARVERALAGLGAGEVLLGGNAPYYAWPGIDVRYTAALCGAAALGYEQLPPAWNMTADLRLLSPTEADEKRLAADGVVVRRAGPADAAPLAAFALANWTPGWAGEITHSIGRERAGCHLALEPDGTPLGFAAYGSSRPSWFGPMGTTAAARGRGIGSVLLRRCLADLRAEGYESAQIGWVGPTPFYSLAVGARVERVFFRYRKAL
ncbi:GNAT family N-acetyltransferase [Actinoplanes sp. CA-030573]|uniref:GNAT family N-acetyltransferase n=1 Tax=Actinoplanes sp. CA-030573 TaxID=3239898 RepID=UPI003D8EF514